MSTMEVHWYCSCGATRQAMTPEVAAATAPSFTCQVCGSLVGPVYESEELIRHEIEEDGC